MRSWNQLINKTLPVIVDLGLHEQATRLISLALPELPAGETLGSEPPASSRSSVN